MQEYYSTKDKNETRYMTIGIDDDRAVVYVFENDELFDYHISMGTTFEQEMKNTIDCYKLTHFAEPTLKDIVAWRMWFKKLKDNNIIY